MSSSLHTAMPTPCLNTFWHSASKIFLELFFCLVSVNFFFCLLSSLKTDNSTEPLTTKNSSEVDFLQPLVA